MSAAYLPTLTLWQPHASLLAAGIKGPETRSWATKYRGRIGIASAKKQPYGGDARGPWVIAYRASVHPGRRPARYLYNPTENRTLELPLGVMVATAELVDCAPIGGPFDFRTGIWEGDEGDHAGRAVVVLHPPLCGEDLWTLVLDTHDGRQIDISDQLPYGIWTPGRFAWLLADVKPVTERCPWCWGLGNTAGRSFAIGPAWNADVGAERCPTCEGLGKCEPVPVRGRERLWRWTP